MSEQFMILGTVQTGPVVRGWPGVVRLASVQGARNWLKISYGYIRTPTILRSQIFCLNAFLPCQERIYLDVLSF